MSQPEDSNRLPTIGEAQRPAKKPYQKPAVRYERVFETSALACGKMQSTQWQCKINRKRS